MATIEENYEFWNDSYDWSRYQGDEWSARWGGPDMQWFWSILPRIQRFLPAAKILEIGPGQGRWTKYLLDHCEELVVVDISERCIEACRERFGTDGITYHVGDGHSLDFLEDQSIDLVFSFESLVHTEIEVLGQYLESVARVLTENGSGFIHHSNLGCYPTYFRMTDRLPKAVRKNLKSRGLLDFDEWRARSVTADKFSQAASRAGLSMLTQELVPWGGRRLIDCFSTFTKRPTQQPNQLFKNRALMNQAYEIQRLSELYGEGVPW